MSTLKTFKYNQTMNAIRSHFAYEGVRVNGKVVNKDNHLDEFKYNVSKEEFANAKGKISESADVVIDALLDKKYNLYKRLMVLEEREAVPDDGSNKNKKQVSMGDLYSAVGITFGNKIEENYEKNYYLFVTNLIWWIKNNPR